MTRILKFPAKIPFLFCTLFCLWPCLAFSDDVNTAWVRRYNGPGNGSDFSVAIAVDSNGNAYVTGSCYGDGTGYDYCTIKYLPSGDTAWVRRYDGPASKNDYAVGLGLDKNGNVYVTGTAAGRTINGGYGSLDIVTIKYFPNGDTAWLRSTFVPATDRPDAKALGLAMDGHSNLYIAGETFHPLYGSYGFTLKYDSAGNYKWGAQRGLSDPPSYIISPIAVDSIGSSVCVIGSDGIFQYDSLGNQVWARNFLGIVRSVTMDHVGNTYVVGIVSYVDFVIIKYNSSGDSLWVRRSGTSPWESYGATFVATDKHTNIYMVGTYHCCIDYSKWLAVKYDSSGNLLWLQEYGGMGPPYPREPRAMVLDTAGNLYVVGNDLFFITTIKYDPHGNLVWEKRYGGYGGPETDASDIAIHKTENVFVFGTFRRESDFIIIKYSFSPILKGDLNLDSILNPTDAVLSLNCIFLGEAPPAAQAACDLNCDGRETSADVVILLLMIFAVMPVPC